MLQHATHQNKVMLFKFELILQEISRFEASFRITPVGPGNHLLLQTDS